MQATRSVIGRVWSWGGGALCIALAACSANDAEVRRSRGGVDNDGDPSSDGAVDDGAVDGRSGAAACATGARADAAGSSQAAGGGCDGGADESAREDACRRGRDGGCVVEDAAARSACAAMCAREAALDCAEGLSAALCETLCVDPGSLVVPGSNVKEIVTYFACALKATLTCNNVSGKPEAIGCESLQFGLNAWIEGNLFLRSQDAGYR